MKPLVTIGIPCLNAAGSLRTAIQSALDQTWPNCEIVVVDDGSKDTSLVQASAFGDRVLVIQSPQRGISHARNMILREARGEWVQFLDAEDYLERSKVATQLEESNGGENADVIFSPVWIETIEGSGASRTRSQTSADPDICKQWINGTLPGIAGCLWRTSALTDMGGWRIELPCCHEEELYARAIKEGLRWRFTPTPGAVLRADVPVFQRKDPGLVIRTKTIHLDALKAWMEKRKTWRPEHQELTSRACFQMARRYARHQLRDAARYHRERRRRGLITVHQTDAPSGYRAIYCAFGFQIAERIAALFR